MENAIYLMRGDTTHARFQPRKHNFHYGVTMLDIDIDRLDEAVRASCLFSIDGPNLISLDTGKVGPCGASSLRDWADTTFREAGTDVSGCTIRLITFPKTEMFSFSPISLWLACHEAEAVGIIYEVHNTFGERHCYVTGLSANPSRQTVPKSFHVSPFFGIEGEYQFTFAQSEAKFDLLIQNVVGNELMHAANLSLHRKPFNTLSLARFLLTAPLSGLGVWIGIHWEALKLFIKKMRYHPKPPVPEKFFSVAHENSKPNFTSRDISS